MEIEYLGVLAALAAPVMLGKVSLKRGLCIVIALGIVLIALNWAHTRIQGVQAIEQLKGRARVQSELELYSTTPPYARDPLQCAMSQSECDPSKSNHFMLPKSSIPA